MSRGCPADVNVLQAIRNEITRIMGEAEKSKTTANLFPVFLLWFDSRSLWIALLAT